MIISSCTIIFQPKIVHPTHLFHTAQLFDSEEYVSGANSLTNGSRCCIKDILQNAIPNIVSGENNFWCECGPPAWKFTNKTAYISCNKTVEIVINDEVAFLILIARDLTFLRPRCSVSKKAIWYAHYFAKWRVISLL